MKIAYSQLFVHILVWILLGFILLFYPYTVNKVVSYPSEFIFKQVVHFFIILLAYYFNSYYLVEKFFIKKQYIKFTFGVILLICFASFFMSFVSRLLDLHTKSPFNIPSVWNKLYLDRFATWTTLLIVCISTVLAIIRKWTIDRESLERLEKDKVQSELSVLKAQIHPHFLFNTLNTVYALSYTDIVASRKALIQVSRMLRYQFYEIQKEEISLQQELDFINDYISIMKLRLNEKSSIRLHLPKKVPNLNIAPMILISYIENVFKHGVSPESEDHIWIEITIDNNILTLQTKNKIVHLGVTIQDEGATGIGMENSLKRLVLMYPNRYTISTDIDSDQFELKLTIALR